MQKLNGLLGVLHCIVHSKILEMNRPVQICNDGRDYEVQQTHTHQQSEAPAIVNAFENLFCTLAFTLFWI